MSVSAGADASIDLTADSPVRARIEPRVGSTAFASGALAPSSSPPPSPSQQAEPGGCADSACAETEGQVTELQQEGYSPTQVEAKVRQEMFSEVALTPSALRFDPRLSVRLCVRASVRRRLRASRARVCECASLRACVFACLPGAL